MQTQRTLYQSLFWRGLYYAAAFILNVLVARHFEAGVSGDIYFLIAVYSIVQLMASFSIESGITYFAARNEISAGKLLHLSLLWTLLTGIIVLIFLFGFTGNIFKGIDQQLLWFSSLAFICGNLLATFCAGIFYARKNFLLPNLVSILTSIVLAVILPYKGQSVIAGIHDNNYFYFYFGSFGLQGLVLAMAVQVKYVRSLLAGFPSLNVLMALFRYCAMAFSSNLIFFLLYRIDYWFVHHYCTPGELGNYIQVSKLVQLFFLLPTILAGAVFPLTAGGEKEKMNRLLAVLSRSIMSLYLVVSGVLVLSGKWLFPFLFGDSFTGMYQPFLLLIPGILSLSGLFTLTAYYAGKNRISVNIRGSMLALLVILAGDSIFIPVYGINAAAGVSSIGYIVFQLYVLVVFKKEYRTPLHQFFISRISDWHLLRKSFGVFLKKQDETKQ